MNLKDFLQLFSCKLRLHIVVAVSSWLLAVSARLLFGDAEKLRCYLSLKKMENVDNGTTYQGEEYTEGL